MPTTGLVGRAPTHHGIWSSALQCQNEAWCAISITGSMSKSYYCLKRPQLSAEPRPGVRADLPVEALGSRYQV